MSQTKGKIIFFILILFLIILLFTQKNSEFGHGTSGITPINLETSNNIESNTINRQIPRFLQQISPIEQFNFWHDEAVLAIDFSPTGSLFASGSNDGTIQIWNMTTREPLLPPFQHSKEVRSVTFSPCETMLVSCSKDTINLWNITNGQIISRIILKPL